MLLIENDFSEGGSMKTEQAPRDPRSRAVTGASALGRGAVAILLECGHVTRRRPLCSPSRVICRECQGPYPLPA